MNEQVNELLQSQQRQGEKVALMNLRHKPRQRQKIDEQTIYRLQQKTTYENTIPSQKLQNYYCSLCGKIVLMLNTIIQILPRRKIDKSIIINLNDIFIKIRMQKDKIKYIQRQKGIQVQYRWKCDCGLCIAYTPISYDNFQNVRNNSINYQFPVLYIYQNILVDKMKQSQLISQLITYKETILIHIKRKNKK